MEGLIVLALLILGCTLVAPILAIVALTRAGRAQSALRGVEERLRLFEQRLRAPAREPAAAEPEPVPAAADVVTLPTPPEPPPSPWPPPLPASPPPPPLAEALPLSEPAPSIVPPPPPPRPPMPPDRGGDFATTLGPRLLVATGAVAFVVFLGLFVKYAWDNDWIGPTGRVLMGAFTGLGLLLGGIRLLGRAYRPLGQGLAGAGLAGLYVSAFGAHGFYDLVPREAAGLLMAAITASAVLLAARLDARLLAALAWLGGYLTPVLLSTGQDKAVALFLYVALLDVGAVILDRRRPWPETVPLAMGGTVLLYLGWYAQFFRPERFTVAAFGIVLFTAIFTFGAARKERGPGLGLSILLSACALAMLAAGANRPEWLLVLSLGLAAAGASAARRFGPWLGLVAMAAAGLPFLAWSLTHYRTEAFGLAAAWVVGALLILVVPAGEDRADHALGLVALGGAGIASIGLGAATDQPAPLLVFLLAQAAIALLASFRWPWAEVVGVATGALTVVAWFEAFFRQGRSGDALLLTLPLGGAWLVARVARSMVRDEPLGRAGAAAHLVNAAFVWIVLWRVLYDESPSILGLASVALAAVYLAIGLASRRAHPGDRLGIRVTLGLAAVFLTLAIPVQLGLHGITLAWGLEGALLLALGLRFGSPLARAGGYVVLVLSLARLPLRHWPVHDSLPFTPVFNAAFGTWLALIVILVGALVLIRRHPEAHGDLDRVALPLLSTAALGLLFLLLTTETGDAFAARARLAHAAGDPAAAERARLLGGLAISVLWTAFATALLAGGLGLRSRPLFYAAYGLFAVTAVKVVLWDLATLKTVYRMLSFLVLALLLMAGAYLNLRFRERLLPRGAPS